ncbi:MAG: tRNA epoxyqueuosine(34) reductase QueG [bacterium]|nr:tRNA epoxyqueuosine(34) reductase QueG [bacterium]
MAEESLVVELAREAGFDLAGIAPLRPPRDAARFDAWIDAGRHGSMDYLARNRDKITDPRRILPGGRSLLVVGFGHPRPPAELEGGGRIARYALGRDYHNALGKRLRKLTRRLEAEGLAGRGRAIVDAGPVLERSHAEEAGIGFLSKAANLLHPDFGPWFFLGEVLLDVELEPTASPPSGSCGTCTACIDACPTGAILEPGLVEARSCISYSTIENRGFVPHELREDQGEWVFGCDVCSEVCPWGERSGDDGERLGTHRAVDEVARAGIVSWIESDPDPAAFASRLEGSPLRRPGRAGLVRNAAIVLGNAPTDAGHRALLKLISRDLDWIVREAATWALARGHMKDAETRARLARALRNETHDEARAGMRASLDRYG